MRVATIDIGTNTVLLLVAERGPEGTLAAVEEHAEHVAEVGVDGVEGFDKTLARFDVDLLNGLFGVADGVE